VRYANNRKVSINLRDIFPYPYTMRDALNWYEIVRDSEPETSFAMDVAGEAVGGIGFTFETDVARRSAEIGYWLGEEFWGRGIATDALIAVSEHVFANYDICRLYAHVFEWNPASARKSVTKDGQTIDKLMYALVRE
jgi:RimJ/RimL family protein N-acetyltransferase